MRKIGFFLIIFLMIGAGCAKNDISFQKKLECSNYISTEKQNIEKYNTENSPYNNLSLLEIFYSTKLDTCLEGLARVTHADFNGKEKVYTSFVLKDILEGKEIKAVDTRSDYDNEVEKFR